MAYDKEVFPLSWKRTALYSLGGLAALGAGVAGIRKLRSRQQPPKINMDTAFAQSVVVGKPEASAPVSDARAEDEPTAAADDPRETEQDNTPEGPTAPPGECESPADREE